MAGAWKIGGSIDNRRRPAASGASGVVLAGETKQRGLVAAVAQPVADLSEPDALVKAARRVPVEHLEIDAAPAVLDRYGGEPYHQPAPDPVPTRAFDHEQIFEIEARAAEPGRKPRMKRRESGRFAVEKGEDRLELAFRAEAVPQQIRLGRDDRIGRPLEGGKPANQPEKQPAIIRRRKTDIDPARHVPGSISRRLRGRAGG